MPYGVPAVATQPFSSLPLGDEGGGLVYSDMMAYTGDFTFAEFEAWAASPQMPGYGRWQIFEAGDYSFDEAMVWVRLIRTSPSIDLKLANLTFYADLPDIIDGGTETIGAAPANFTFNRAFYEPPDDNFNAVVRSGTGVKVVWSAISKTGFTAEIKDAAGTTVAGSFVWATRGI